MNMWLFELLHHCCSMCRGSWMRAKIKHAQYKYFSRDTNEKNKFNVFLKRYIHFSWFHKKRFLNFTTFVDFRSSHIIYVYYICIYSWTYHRRSELNCDWILKKWSSITNHRSIRCSADITCMCLFFLYVCVYRRMCIYNI